ncbi:unnamed protein product, partial [Effrenium voratum]
GDKNDLVPRGLVFLRRVEELMSRAVAGLCVNAAFARSFDAQVTACSEMLKAVAEMLAGKKKEEKQKPAPKLRDKDKAFQVQEGAATGRGAGRKSQGVDEAARAGALGGLGLRVLRQTLQGAKAHKGTECGLKELVPAVVACFASR